MLKIMSNDASQYFLAFTAVFANFQRIATFEKNIVYKTFLDYCILYRITQ